MSKTFFLVAGETSGDIHGSHLIQEIRKQMPSAKFTGVGGPRMRAAGLNPILNMEDFQILGLAQVILSLPKIYRQFQTVRTAILKQQPDAVIFIDYPGFNLRMAKSLRKKGFTGKLVQYVCPTVWAWGKGRIKTMVSNLDLLLCIFPFEKKIFEETNLKVEYIGHPLTQELTKLEKNDAKKSLGLKQETEVLSLYPGSRKGEVKKHLPKMLGAAKIWESEKPDRCVAVSCSTKEFDSLIRSESRTHGIDVWIVEGSKRHALMDASETAIAKIGTIALELALHQTPSVAVYEVSHFNRLFFGLLFGLIRLPHYCIVNLLANKRIFPEQVPKFTSCTVPGYIKALSSIKREECIEECQKIYSALSTENPNGKGAEAILGLL